MIAFRSLVLTAAIGAVLMLAAPSANAGLIHAGLGSGVCKATDGQNTDLEYSLFTIKNISTTTQNVTCNTEFIREYLVNLLPGAGYKLTMIIGSSSLISQTVTCTASVGHGGGVAVQSTKTTATVAGVPGRLDFTAAELRAGSDVDSLAVLCGLKPKTTIGLFIASQPEVNVLIP